MRPSSLALQPAIASMRFPRSVPNPVSSGVEKGPSRDAEICSQGYGRFQRRRPRNSRGVSTPEHPNKISWTRKMGLCGKNWGWSWITDVDQLKAQQHYVQHLLGKRKSVLQKCCKSGFRLPGGISCTPASSGFPRKRPRESKPEQSGS